MSAAIYSPHRIAGGLLFISGQLPIRSDGGVPDDFSAQVDTVFGRIGVILREHRLDFGSVVRLTYFLRDIGDLASLRATAEPILPHPRPTASLVEVSNLVDERCRLEIDAIAELAGDR